MGSRGKTGRYLEARGHGSSMPSLPEESRESDPYQDDSRLQGDSAERFVEATVALPLYRHGVALAILAVDQMAVLCRGRATPASLGT